MGKKRVIISVLAAVILVASLFLSFLSYSRSLGNYTIELPPEPSGDIGKEDDEPVITTAEIPDFIDVTADNVKLIIETIKRTENYFQEYYVELFFEGGNGSALLKREAYYKDGVTRYIVFDINGMPAENYLITDGVTYIWNDGSKSYYSGGGNITAEQSGNLYSYRDILGEEKENVIGGGFIAIGEEPCIFAEVFDGDTEQRRQYWVSLNTGLLIAAETYKGDKMTYRMRQTAFSESAYDSMFLLPDGNDVFSMRDVVQN